MFNTTVKIIFSIIIIAIWLIVPVLADNQVDIWLLISPIVLVVIGAIVYYKDKHENNRASFDSYSKYLDDKLNKN